MKLYILQLLLVLSLLLCIDNVESSFVVNDDVYGGGRDSGLPILRFSKNMLTPNERHQLICIGGTARGTNEEAEYLICKSSMNDIYHKDVEWKCQSSTISKNVRLTKLNIDCPKLNVDYTYGDDHPCNLEYHLDWVDNYTFSKKAGWGILGVFFFYIFLKRNTNLYSGQISNPIFLPREQINPKVFRALGIVVSIIVFISTIVFILLCLLMFSAPI
ncbi:hypothetical protein CYY_000161 [Polysphondylium violaceum]|uniref:Store-operated calcium entry-associated regulatory factor n=1 Tax=Polysphondylium violaceum TaxID=133409 RepID=A0A8J4QBI5_9MYCE|nr:hypothetical protein CYY_000161 [Polysphondylium violaceum]